MRPTVAAPNPVERGAQLPSPSYVTTSFFSLLFFSSPPFPLSTSLMHTHTHTHAFMCAPESMSSFYLWLADWVGSFLLKLFVRLSYK